MPPRSRSSSRTDIRSPARAARRRMRWASWRARTQVKTWTRMLCPVQWCMGEKDTTRVSFIWRKENSASDWDRYPATTSGTGQSSWLVISTCLPNSSCSSAARAFPGNENHSRVACSTYSIGYTERGPSMSLTVSPDLLGQARHGDVDDAAFTACIQGSLPYAWQV